MVGVYNLQLHLLYPLLSAGLGLYFFLYFSSSCTVYFNTILACFFSTVFPHFTPLFMQASVAVLVLTFFPRVSYLFCILKNIFMMNDD